METDAKAKEGTEGAAKGEVSEAFIPCKIVYVDLKEKKHAYVKHLQQTSDPIDMIGAAKGEVRGGSIRWKMVFFE